MGSNVFTLIMEDKRKEITYYLRLNKISKNIFEMKIIYYFNFHVQEFDL